jgi:hypothetical protein
VASRVTKCVTFFTGTTFCFILHIIIILYIYYFKSLTFLREITPHSCYFNIIRDLIIYLRDLIKSPFLSSPCDISIKYAPDCTSRNEFCSVKTGCFTQKIPREFSAKTTNSTNQSHQWSSVVRYMQSWFDTETLLCVLRVSTTLELNRLTYNV